jgi:hypothetical protein
MDAIELVLRETYVDNLNSQMLSEVIVNVAHELAHFEQQ